MQRQRDGVGKLDAGDNSEVIHGHHHDLCRFAMAVQRDQEVIAGHHGLSGEVGGQIMHQGGTSVGESDHR